MLPVPPVSPTPAPRVKDSPAPPAPKPSEPVKPATRASDSVGKVRTPGALTMALLPYHLRVAARPHA